jgi:membrane protease YdiL (CAAX protease family)
MRSAWKVEGHRIENAVTSDSLILSSFAALSALGCFSMYAYVTSGESVAVGIGLFAELLALFTSLAYSVFAWRERTSVAAASIALFSSLVMVTILLPSSGNVYVDAVLLLAVGIGAVTSFARGLKLPAMDRPELGVITVVMVLVLPVLLAFAEALFLGLRFWEEYQLGIPMYPFIPFIALYGYLEEGLFRGVVQRSLVPVTGVTIAILIGAILNASYMMFWGSIMYGVFTFLVALLMGLLYQRSRSLMFVGTIRALQDTWLMLAFLLLGIVTH